MPLASLSHRALRGSVCCGRRFLTASRAAQASAQPGPLLPSILPAKSAPHRSSPSASCRRSFRTSVFCSVFGLVGFLRSSCSLAASSSSSSFAVASSPILSRNLASVAASSLLGTRATMATATDPTGTVDGDEAKRLQELWATAFEAWVMPPGAAAGEVVYLRPAKEEEMSSCANDPPAWMTPTLAAMERFAGVYGLTSFDPPGMELPFEVNMENNRLLEADLKSLCEETGGFYWPSFGFDPQWHEKGFSVAAPKERVLEIAIKYKQGAIYRFFPSTEKGGPPIMRETVPACLPQTEAMVPLVSCAAPPLPQASPNWPLDAPPTST